MTNRKHMTSEEPVWFRCQSCRAEFCIGEKLPPPDPVVRVTYCPYCGIPGPLYAYQLHPVTPLRFAE